MRNMPIVEFAQTKDIPELIFLLNCLFEQEKDFVPNAKLQEEGLTQIITNGNIGKIIVIREECEIIGMVTLLFTISTALGKQVAILEDMIVHPNHRNKGIGSQLLKNAINFAYEIGLKRITLLTDLDNSEAQKFYKKHNFKPSAMTPFRLILNNQGN